MDLDYGVIFLIIEIVQKVVQEAVLEIVSELRLCTCAFMCPRAACDWHWNRPLQIVLVEDVLRAARELQGEFSLNCHCTLFFVLKL